MRNALLFGSLAVLLTLLAGCGGSSKPAAVKAGGKVVYRKNTPTPGALIVFHPLDPNFEKTIGGKPFATVRDDGTFALTTYEEGDGAPAGEYGVTVDWKGPKKDKGAKFALSGEGGGSSGPSVLNPKYGDPQNLVIKVTVKPGQANDFTIDVD